MSFVGRETAAIDEQVQNFQSEEEEVDEEDSAFLSLNVKPDRNLALLDDYELEELDHSDPNHRSGSFPNPN